MAELSSRFTRCCEGTPFLACEAAETVLSLESVPIAPLRVVGRTSFKGTPLNFFLPICLQPPENGFSIQSWPTCPSLWRNVGSTSFIHRRHQNAAIPLSFRRLRCFWSLGSQIFFVVPADPIGAGPCFLRRRSASQLPLFLLFPLPPTFLTRFDLAPRQRLFQNSVDGPLLFRCSSQ